MSTRDTYIFTAINECGFNIIQCWHWLYCRRLCLCMHVLYITYIVYFLSSMFQPNKIITNSNYFNIYIICTYMVCFICWMYYYTYLLTWNTYVCVCRINCILLKSMTKVKGKMYFNNESKIAIFKMCFDVKTLICWLYVCVV